MHHYARTTPEFRQFVSWQLRLANLCRRLLTTLNKKQFLKFSKAIADSTNVKETISAFENKKGYAGRRTLERCYQAAAGFKKGLPSKVIAEKTGWSVKYVDKIRSWVEGEFGKTIRPPAMLEVAYGLAEVLGLLQEVVRKLAQAEAYDANHVAVSRKRALAEVMYKELADVAPDGIYSLTAIQARLLRSIPERRIECLRESLGGIDLTQPEEETLLGALTKSGLAERLREYAEPLYRRIKALERHHYPLTTSDVMLIRTAAEMDDDQFNKVLKAASYNEEPDYNADVISAAAKLLLDIGEQVVLMDEVEKDNRMGSTKEAATSIAQGRMELAKRLAVSWFPRFIRAFALTLANETKPATGWVKVENG